MVNKVVHVGLLDKDQELRYTPAGDASCNFTLQMLGVKSAA